MKVMVINQHGSNKGDRAVLTALLRELDRNHVSDVTVSVHDPQFCRPDDFETDAVLRFIPWGWRVESSGRARTSRLARSIRHHWYRAIAHPLIRRFYGARCLRYFSAALTNPEFTNAARASDLVISTGGHHFTTLLAREAVSPQFHDLAVACMLNRSVAIWSQSIGPFEFKNPSSRDFARRVLSELSRIYIRDDHSALELRSLGITGPDTRNTFESVLGLGDQDDTWGVAERDSVVGISVYNILNRPKPWLMNYVASLAQLVDHCVQLELTPCFFPMELKGTRSDDRPLIHQIVAAAQRGSRCRVVDDDLPTRDHLAQVARCEVFVGHKTHSVVFALLTGTPAVAIAYHQKTRDIMQQYGLGDYCLDDDNLTGETLISAFDAARAHRDEISRIASVRTRGFAALIHRDFSAMLETFGSLSS